MKRRITLEVDSIQTIETETKESEGTKYKLKASNDEEKITVISEKEFSFAAGNKIDFVIETSQRKLGEFIEE